MLDQVGFLMEDQEVLTYDRSQTLPEQQRDYLDNMDTMMDKGFILGEESIPSPDFQQKTQFVALNLVNALLKEDDQEAIMLFTYLVNRMPDLKQAKAKTKEGTAGRKIGIEFIFDEVKPQGEKIQFQPNVKLH